MKRNNQFWHLKFVDDYDRTKETFREYRNNRKLYYDYDKKIWVHRAEYTGSYYPATEYPNSFKNRWDEIVSITSANVAQNEYKWANGRYRGSV